ncbi:precorrin-2 C(20)-methyltransferase [Diaphorobacter aerolatus]|uniref:Precorrin-2 C(20)-methyltransferase n=1 Tax=Diaphorobacter aerolatus TaxID=1288495 RepID=A0A7H0GJF8_9BURK|nr:precorrin-2 C(20)-methyltransferase [Diaphorobacter aerolatus]QNP48424.1 precorrin-2 C(20)-methyltransferase [Diaphorobacter aerolatus]
MSRNECRGQIVCLGLGPGDPELMSVKADRILRNARHVAFFRKRGHPGKARQLVTGMLHEQVTEYPMEYPITTEIPASDPRYVAQLSEFYRGWQARLTELAREKEVIVLCEGDPFFYGSFMHLYIRLRDAGEVPVQVLPGIPGMVGCWHATGIPVTWGDDAMSVLPATLPDLQLRQHMECSDALVIMKVGRHLGRIRSLLAERGTLDRAWLVINGTMEDQQVMPLRDAPERCPYFAIVIVHGQGRRPADDMPVDAR